MVCTCVIHFAGKEVRKLLEDAMTKGYIESALTILIFVGVMGSGKTLFKHLVLGLPVPEHSPSTPIAESSIRSMSIWQVSVSGEGSVKWSLVTPKDMLDMVGDAIKTGEVPVLDSSWEDVIQLSFSQCTDLDELLQFMEDMDYKEMPKHTEQPSDVIDNTSEQQLAELDGSFGQSPRKSKGEDISVNSTTALSSQFVTALKEIDIDQKLMQRISESPGCKKLMEIDFVYIVDSGGQPPFREMLPHFVHESSAFVLMQKLNESLGFKPAIKYRGEGSKLHGVPYPSQLTNQEVLYQYFQAVQSHNSRVFVVGTHRDLEDQCEESREKKNQMLLEAFRPVLGQRIVLYQPGDPDQFMFPVDSKSPKPQDQKTAQVFREAVMKLCLGKKVKIPLPWFVLEQLLRQLAEMLHTKVLSIEECYEVAHRKLYMPQNVCQAAIEYLGNLNIFFYRPRILLRVVFCDSQVILDKITELVRCSHELKGSSSGSLPHNRQGGEWLDFRDYGKITPKLLEEFPSHYRVGLFAIPDFLKLLQGLLISGELKSGEHFMPSVLPDLPLEKVAENRVMADHHPAPMTIHYPKMWLPVGVVPSLVAYLQNHSEWTPVARGGRPACMYRNCMQFELPGGKPGKVTLIDSTKFLEIHVQASLKVAGEVCPQIREMVLSGLKEAHKSLHYDPPTAEEGFLCSGECGNSEVHLATLSADRETWRCSEDPSVGDDLNHSQTLWLTSVHDKGDG